MNCLYHYTACGLSITSDIPVPGLATTLPSRPADLHIDVVQEMNAKEVLGETRVRYVSRERYGDGTPQLTAWTGSTGAHRLLYRDGTEFRF